MNQKLAKILFPTLLTITLFSLWAGFALLVVNKLFYQDLPGYTIGRICIWEFVALVVVAAVVKLLVSRWGNVEIREMDNRKYLVMNPNLGPVLPSTSSLLSP